MHTKHAARFKGSKHNSSAQASSPMGDRGERADRDDTGDRGERGAVLITMLLLVAIMALVVTLLLQSVNTATNQSLKATNAEQAFWYSLSAESFAGSLAEQSARLGKLTLQSPLIHEPSTFRLDGGSITAQLRDAEVCFNVNALVSEDGTGVLRPNPEAGAQLIVLFEALGFNTFEASSLTAKITDWIDSDSQPENGGAEDFNYQLARPPYRTPGTFMLDIQALRALDGMNAAIYRQISPYLCALPTSEMAQINVNMLQDYQAPLLVMLTSGALSVSEALGVIRDRPSGGYNRLDDFWAHQSFQTDSGPISAPDLTRIDTRYFALSADVLYAGEHVYVQSLIELDDAGASHTVWRTFGALPGASLQATAAGNSAPPSGL